MSSSPVAASMGQPQPMTPLRKTVVFGGLAVGGLALAVALVAATVLVFPPVAAAIGLGIAGYAVYAVAAGSVLALGAIAISLIAL
ncbi:MAG: hypothetical protein KDK62_06660, partial [Chlamydiia bacterium]|nr:hypothetical protein [Chlamydiia bacterium]